MNQETVQEGVKNEVSKQDDKAEESQQEPRLRQQAGARKDVVKGRVVGEGQQQQTGVQRGIAKKGMDGEEGEEGKEFESGKEEKSSSTEKGPGKKQEDHQEVQKAEARKQTDVHEQKAGDHNDGLEPKEVEDEAQQKKKREIKEARMQSKDMGTEQDADTEVTEERQAEQTGRVVKGTSPAKVVGSSAQVDDGKGMRSPRSRRQDRLEHLTVGRIYRGAVCPRGRGKGGGDAWAFGLGSWDQIEIVHLPGRGPDAEHVWLPLGCAGAHCPLPLNR